MRNRNLNFDFQLTVIIIFSCDVKLEKIRNIVFVHILCAFYREYVFPPARAYRIIVYGFQRDSSLVQLRLHARVSMHHC